MGPRLSYGNPCLKQAAAICHNYWLKLVSEYGVIAVKVPQGIEPQHLLDEVTFLVLILTAVVRVEGLNARGARTVYFCDGLESFEQNQTLKGFALPQPPLR